MLIVDVKIEISLFNDAWKEQKLNIIGLYTPLSIKLEIYKTHPIFNFLSYFECNDPISTFHSSKVMEIQCSSILLLKKKYNLVFVKKYNSPHSISIYVKIQMNCNRKKR